MILCLDVGNSQIHGGVFTPDGQIQLQFRQTSRSGSSSDEYGLFLRSVLRENQFDPHCITETAICSVVPELMHSLTNAFRKYFDHLPFFLQAGVKTGLRIKYHNPLEVGADRIANCIAATTKHPDQNLLIIDFGTANTVCAVTKNRDYLGGAITPGLRISMEALEAKTSKLPSVAIVQPPYAVGRTTTEGIQSGLYYGTLGCLRELCRQITQEEFEGEQPIVLGTGGFASLFAGAQLFDEEVPELVLQGLFLALEKNRGQGKGPRPLEGLV